MACWMENGSSFDLQTDKTLAKDVVERKEVGNGIEAFTEWRGRIVSGPSFDPPGSHRV
mgnify:CR=1 FL=1